MKPTPIDLEGAVVLVTGGARGIGAATATRFVEAGARVAIGDLHLEAARVTADAIGATVHRLDVTDRASMAAFVDAAISAHGPVDVLVNNAGIMPNGRFLDLDEATDRKTIEVNLFGVLHGMRAVLPGMVERRRGHVVNVASLAGKFPIKGLAVYNASKFAVVGLTAATRLEIVDSGVTLTAVLPSAVDTALASGLDMWPIPKVSPDAIADAVVASVAARPAEIPIPGYVGALADLTTILPTAVTDRVRRLVRDDRALVPDRPGRTAYRESLAEQQAAGR